jgi:acetyltransferase-like isoleucine patch superfamily enzyme
MAWKALGEIGWRKAIRFGFFHTVGILLGLADPVTRVWMLRRCGARLGPETLVHDVRFINLYRAGFPAFETGRCCFVGEDCLLDLADRIVLGEHVTLAERVTVLTHVNVGYRDHPLQAVFPAKTAPVILENGCFVATGATLLPGVTVGARGAVAAGAVVTENVPSGWLVAGIPARPVRELLPGENSSAPTAVS